MDEALSRLNAFLRPKGEVRTVSKDRFELNSKELLRDYDPETLLELLQKELGGFGNLLGKIRVEYEQFLTSSNVAFDTSPFLLPVARNEANLKEDDSEKEVVQDDPMEKDHPTKHPKDMDYDRRLLRTFMRGDAGESSQKSDPMAKLLGDVDWDRIHACTKDLNGVLEVIPIYTKCFQTLANALGEQKPSQAKLLLKIWKGHLELLLMIVSKVKKELSREARRAEIRRETTKLKSKVESSQSKLGKAQAEISKLEKAKNSLKRRAEQLEANIDELIETEQQLNVELQEVGFDVEEALQILHKEEEEWLQLQDEEEEDDEDDDKPKNDEEDNDEDVRSDRESSDDDDLDDNEGVFLTGFFQDGAAGGAKTDNSSTDEDDESLIEEEEDEIGNFDHIIDKQEEENKEMQDELLRLNQEIENVERQAQRQRERRLLEEEAKRISQMVKSRNVVGLKDLYEDICELRANIEREGAKNRKVLATREMAYHATWNDTPYQAREDPVDEPIQDDEEKKKKKKSPDPSNKKKKMAKGNNKKKKRKPLKLNVPGIFDELFQAEQIDALFEYQERRVWTLKNVQLCLNRFRKYYLAQLHEESEDRVSIVRTEKTWFARMVYVFFVQEYGNSDRSLAELGCFLHSMMTSYKTKSLAVYFFLQFCENPVTLIESYFHTYQEMFHDKFIEQDMEGKLWTPVEPILTTLTERYGPSLINASELEAMSCAMLPGPQSMICVDDVMMMLSQSNLIS